MLSIRVQNISLEEYIRPSNLALGLLKVNFKYDSI
jgi:hypothetical protein